jgi:deoxyribonuclease-4
MAPQADATARGKERPSRLMLLGAHVSTAGGVDKALGRAVSIGCTAMQLFVKNNMQWFAPAPFTPAELRAYHEHAEMPKLGFIFGHSGYMINLAATNPLFLEKSRQALREELLRAEQLRLPFLVLHPGAHMGAGVEGGLLTVVQKSRRRFRHDTAGEDARRAGDHSRPGLMSRMRVRTSCFHSPKRA